MNNRAIGWLIVGISLLIGFLTYLFNRALTEIVSESCSHGTTCPMWGSIRFQTNVGLGIMIFVILIGLYFVIFSKGESKSSTEKSQIKPKDLTKIVEKLNPDERKIFDKIINSEGSVFQSDLVSEGLTKVKVTRILDKLEGKGLIERKRRGMTNIVLLKN